MLSEVKTCEKEETTKSRRRQKRAVVGDSRQIIIRAGVSKNRSAANLAWTSLWDESDASRILDSSPVAGSASGFEPDGNETGTQCGTGGGEVGSGSRRGGFEP